MGVLFILVKPSETLEYGSSVNSLVKFDNRLETRCRFSPTSTGSGNGDAKRVTGAFQLIMLLLITIDRDRLLCQLVVHITAELGV